MWAHGLDSIEVSVIREDEGNHLSHRSKARSFYQRHIITFWMPTGLLAFRTKKKPLQLKQINVLTRPSRLDRGPRFKLSLSLVSNEREEAKEPLARRYRSVNRDLPGS